MNQENNEYNEYFTYIYIYTIIYLHLFYLPDVIFFEVFTWVFFLEVSSDAVKINSKGCYFG